jgi:hypothetical protein
MRPHAAAPLDTFSYPSLIGAYLWGVATSHHVTVPIEWLLFQKSLRQYANVFGPVESKDKIKHSCRMNVKLSRESADTPFHPIILILLYTWKRQLLGNDAYMNATAPANPVAHRL